MWQKKLFTQIALEFSLGFQKLGIFTCVLRLSKCQKSLQEMPPWWRHKGELRNATGSLLRSAAHFCNTLGSWIRQPTPTPSWFLNLQSGLGALWDLKKSVSWDQNTIVVAIDLDVFIKSYKAQNNSRIKSLAWNIWILWGILVLKSCRTLLYSTGMPG